MGSSTWYPVNDEPTDKASYRITVTVDKPFQAVSNGVLLSTTNEGSRRRFVWEQKEPMASYLAIVHVGRWEEETLKAGKGIPIRLYTTADDTRPDPGRLPQDARDAGGLREARRALPLPLLRLGRDRRSRALLLARDPIDVDVPERHRRIHGGARAGAPVVRQFGHHRRVARPLAGRGLRHLFRVFMDLPGRSEGVQRRAAPALPRYEEGRHRAGRGQRARGNLRAQHLRPRGA